MGKMGWGLEAMKVGSKISGSQKTRIKQKLRQQLMVMLMEVQMGMKQMVLRVLVKPKHRATRIQTWWR